MIMFEGEMMRLVLEDDGIAELVLDARDASVNTLSRQALQELETVLDSLEQAANVQGLLICSAKPDFILGADITEFMGLFALPPDELRARLARLQQLFSRLEHLPFPTLSLINGMALGGGFELALSTDFRVMSRSGRVGLPEVNLGICPGWGGTVRLTRLIGAQLALSWMLTGKPAGAEAALEQGAVDLVVAADQLNAEGRVLLRAAIKGEVDFHEARARKHVQLHLQPEPLVEAFARKLDPHYPAPAAILQLVAAHAGLPFREALALEQDTLIQLAGSEVTRNLIGLFLNDQLLKRKARAFARQSLPVGKAAVVGAGVMGGGIAFQSASKGVPVVMKDIRQDALELGVKTAAGLLDKQVERGRLSESAKAKVLGAISPQLDFAGFADVDLVVEAVVEQPQVKASVLVEVEHQLSEHAVLTSNTSTISIGWLAGQLQHPERFCGMHFFNPVHRMPLVEVVRDKETAESTIARVMAYAMQLGKTPILVNDCPGFLVNRILFPYFNAFNRLLLDRVPFERIDAVMEAFGWPMGPAYLADVVGLDILVHADRVLQQGYGERMAHDGDLIAEKLLDAGSRGQKSGAGFYVYGQDERGPRSRQPSAQAQSLIDASAGEPLSLSDEEILERMMIPLCLEAVRCLDEGVVDSPAEVDMGLILGLGFPRFRGGALRYIDSLGLDQFAARAEFHQSRGALYQLTEGFRARQRTGQRFYP